MGLLSLEEVETAGLAEAEQELFENPPRLVGCLYGLASMKRASNKDSRQAEHIEERSTPRTPVIYDVVRRYGEEEMARPAISLWLSGLAAGPSMSFSLLAEAILRMHIAEYDW